MRISDWSSDVCSSDLLAVDRADRHALAVRLERLHCPAVACALRIDRGIGRGAALALLLRRGPPHRLRVVAEAAALYHRLLHAEGALPAEVGGEQRSVSDRPLVSHRLGEPTREVGGTDFDLLARHLTSHLREAIMDHPDHPPH